MPESKAYRLILTEEAVLGLDRLDLFLRPVNPRAANRFQDAIWSAFQLLKQQPLAGRPWPHRGAQNIRELFVPFGKRAYVLRYRVAERELVIARIHHSQENR